MMAGARPDLVSTLTEFGEQIGCAFQLSDDIIDVASESTELGKVSGTDLREGVPTLPTLIAQQSHHPTDSRLLELLSGPISDESLHAEALRLLRNTAAAGQGPDRGPAPGGTVQRLLGIPWTTIPARAALVSICDLLATRTS